MRILIVEDEPPIARDIGDAVRSILGSTLTSLHVAFSLDKASEFIQKHRFDLCFLDLNLSGEDGFELLQQALAHSFHTIVISGHTDNALRAFEYGVIDFVPKPFTTERLRKAVERITQHGSSPAPARFLTARKNRRHLLLPIDCVEYLKANRYLVEVHLKDGRMELIEKPLDRLKSILPGTFIRIHRSFIVNLEYVDSYRHAGQGCYRVQMKSGTHLPLSRTGHPLLLASLKHNP